MLNQKKNHGIRILANTTLVLEGITGSVHGPITLKSTKKKEMEAEIRMELADWMQTSHFEEFRNKKLDLAIVAFVDKLRMKNQDVDNIAKVVLDSLRKSKKDHSKPYLFEDDSQIVRLLIYKLERGEYEEYETNSMAISFREHDPSKQMILVEQTVI